MQRSNECPTIDSFSRSFAFEENQQVANSRCAKIFFRHFSASKRKHKTIKSCFAHPAASASNSPFNYKSPNRFQLLGGRKLPKTRKKHRQTNNRTASGIIRIIVDTGGPRQKKTCFQFTANDFEFFCKKGAGDR